jgi:hypothetical protein
MLVGSTAEAVEALPIVEPVATEMAEQATVGRITTEGTVTEVATARG